MSGWTKLFSSIVDSSIWFEPDHVRLVWITMLAIKNKDGIVEAAIPGLANRAQVSIEKCKDALERLSSPDEYSRSQEYNGRRIAPIDGGWIVLNHAKYRDSGKEDREREMSAERSKRYREKSKRHGSVTVASRCHHAPSRCHHAPSPHTDTDTDTEVSSNADPKLETNISNSNGKKKTLKKRKPDGFDEFWGAYPRKVGKQAAIKAFEKALESGLPPIDTLVSIIKQQADSKHFRGVDGIDYIPHPTTWLNQGRWEDTITPQHQRSDRNNPRADMADALNEWRVEQERRDRESGIDNEMLLDYFGKLPGEVVSPIKKK